MASEVTRQTLQPTALVHEAWMRLVGAENPKFANRAHFFAAAAEVMRRILIDNAPSLMILSATRRRTHHSAKIRSIRCARSRADSTSAAWLPGCSEIPQPV